MTNTTITLKDRAPDFALKDQHGEEVRLSDLKGRKVLLSFHPLAWTAICADQMKSLERNAPVLEQLNTVAFGISVDSVPSKKAWAEHLEIVHTGLLSDFWPHGEVAQLYGIFRVGNGFSERANILIDENQKAAFVKVYPLSELPDIREIIQVLE
ncbi:MAG: redoxin domain-containing protein [Theionarchaea archaeon]|nr:redoxin domain-containing protein [Theionarchaea archaeon]